MKTLNWYVTRGFLLAFSMAIAILTFGMTGANLVKVLDYVSQGISFWTFLELIYTYTSSPDTGTRLSIAVSKV